MTYCNITNINIKLILQCAKENAMLYTMVHISNYLEYNKVLYYC